jgi:hypothetical protein
MRRFLTSGLLLFLVLSFGPSPHAAEEPQAPSAQPPLLPFHPGEQLTYRISWSNVFSAGTATMEVRQERTADGREALRFVSRARSLGIVDAFYRVDDMVQSLFDPRAMVPLSYSMRQRHGKRKKHRDLTFDHAQGRVVYHKDGFEDIAEIPGDAQDALSSLYVLRSRETFTTSQPVIINVHDSGKTWAVEIHVLGRERVKVPAGEFDTIKIKTYPKYEGVFMHKGEIFIWLTDDRRRVPVLMKSTITIGSIMASLTDMRLGDGAQ